MHIFSRFLFFISYSSLLLTFSSCSRSQANGDNKAATHTPVKHFIVIGVDGMSPDGIRNANTPVMDMMMAEGSYTLRGRCTLPSSSSTNWESMVTGVGPEQHGVTSNSWERDDYILPPVIKGDEGIFPTIFSVIRKQMPDAEIGAEYHWEGFGRLIEKTALSYDHHIDGAQETADAAAKYIIDKKPNFLFIHLDHVDHAGHSIGHGTPGYYKAVELADTLIGEILDAAKKAGITDDLVILVTADHGGIGMGHGGETLAEVEIPYILYGTGIKKGHEMKQPIYTYDQAPTVAYALGLKPLNAWIGRPTKSAFVGNPDPDMGNQVMPFLSPVIYPKRSGTTPAGGLYIDTIAGVRMSNPEGKGTIYYTLDGTKPTKNSPHYTGPFKLERTTVVRAITIDETGNSSLESDAFFRLVLSKSNHGVTYKYIEDPKNEWTMLPNFGSYPVIRTGRALEMRQDQVGPLRDNYYGVEFEGYVLIEEAGEYRFYLSSDDGSRLYINGHEVVNNDGDHGTIERSGTVDLQPGYQKIKVEWFNGGGGATLDVYYHGPGIPKQILPADKLFQTQP